MAGEQSESSAQGTEDDKEDFGMAVFEGTALRLKHLSLEEMDALVGQPSPLVGAFRIRLARSEEARRDAGALVERRYATRGYDIPELQGDPHLFTFLAFDEGRLVGTVSIRLDSDAGMSADALYRVEIDQLRSNGHRLCEFTRLAVDVSAASKPVLAALFHTAYLFAYRLRGISAAIIEVNPRHVVFYQRALAFNIVGEERMNERVNAPAILMRVYFEDISEGLEKFAGQPSLANATRTLFPYGFPPKDAEGILARMREALGTGASQD